jgi:hypothetical protein
VFIISCSFFIEYKLSDLDELGSIEGGLIISVGDVVGDEDEDDGELNEEIASIYGDDGEDEGENEDDGELNEEISSIYGDGDGSSDESELNIANVELFILIFFSFREKFPVTVVSHNKSLTFELFQSVTHICSIFFVTSFNLIFSIKICRKNVR